MSSLPQISSKLADLMRDAFVPPLFEALNDVVGNLRYSMLARLTELEVDRGPYVEGILQLRERHDVIMTGFRHELDIAWGAGPESVQDTRYYGTDALADHADEMELVGEDELEVRLATDHFADAIAREWKPELLALNGYLSWIDSSLRVDAANGPHSPQRVALAVYGAFAASRLPGKIRSLAIHCSQREFVELMGPIYESLHAQLIRRLGPQDNLDPRTRRATEIPSADQEAPAPEPDWLTSFFADWEVESAAEKSTTAPVPAPLPEQLKVMLERSRTLRRRDVASLGERGERTAQLTRRELVAALTLLQIAPKETQEAILDAEAGLAEGMKLQLMAEARKLGTLNADVKLSEGDENVLDLIGMLFQVIFKESHLTRSQQLTLCQLIAPMAKVALDDRKLFLHASHPSRRFLNALVEASEGNRGETDEQRALLERVEEVVLQLVAEFDESQTVFRSLRTEFMAFYSHYQSAAEQAASLAADATRASESRAQVLSDARQTLSASLEGRSVPAALRHAIEVEWPQHAVRMTDANRPRSAVLLLNGFLQALEDAESAAGENDWTAAVEWLQPIWMAAGHGLDEASRRKQVLLSSLTAPQGDAPDAEATEASIETDSLAGPAPELLHPEERRQGISNQDHVTAAYFRQLGIGSWLDFIDRNNRVQAGKLTWVSPISSRLMFVNRGGARICVVSVEELVLMSRLGRVRIHRDEDAFYSAMQGVVDQLAISA
ncbi:DUF1631 family protein [Thermomonas sp.]